MTTTTMTKKAQVTIPKRVREAAGLKPGGKVNVSVEGGKVVLTPAGKAAKSEYRRRIESVRGTLETRLTTEQIMELLRGDPA